MLKHPIKVLLADDHPVVRKGISSCLAHHSQLQVIGEAVNGEEALRKARELAPDVVLMDIDMPRMNGLIVTEILRRELPEVRVLVLSMLTDTDYVVRVIQSGARGYLLKTTPTDELVKAIEKVYAGETCFSPDVARVALNQFVRGDEDADGSNVLTLSAREREVLTLVADGLSNKEIAMHLGVGVRTIETHRERIMRKLDIHSIAGLTRFAIARGLVAWPQASQQAVLAVH
jgi:two-component system, NarL family, nitrate/nitrite response regulator NarL